MGLQVANLRIMLMTVGATVSLCLFGQTSVCDATLHILSPPLSLILLFPIDSLFANVFMTIFWALLCPPCFPMTSFGLERSVTTDHRPPASDVSEAA